MPVGRIILKTISESKKLSSLKTDGARLLYTWLIPHLNVNGCFSADPIVVRARIFTRLDKSIEDINSFLDDLENNNLIIRYNSNGDDFLIVPKFAEKQPKLNPEREGKINIPLPTHEQLTSNSRPTPTQYKLNQVKLNKANATPEQFTPVDNSPKEQPPPEDAFKENQNKELRELYQKVQKYYPDFHLQQFYQTFHKKHPEAINHTLKTLITNAENKIIIKNPWEWCEKIIINESQNYTANDHQKRSEEFKKPGLVSFADIMNGIKLHAQTT
jgi:hypothetical protein